MDYVHFLNEEKEVNHLPKCPRLVRFGPELEPALSKRKVRVHPPIWRVFSEHLLLAGHLAD